MCADIKFVKLLLYIFETMTEVLLKCHAAAIASRFSVSSDISSRY